MTYLQKIENIRSNIFSKMKKYNQSNISISQFLITLLINFYTMLNTITKYMLSK